MQGVGVGAGAGEDGGLESEGIIVERITQTILYTTAISQTNIQIDYC